MTKTTLALFALLLALAYGIEWTYNAGVFYRNHMHEHVVSATKHTVALTLTLLAFAYTGAQWVWTNRQDQLDAAGRPFIYISPATA